ncbi:hypothetical protein L1O03_00270 [Corynebacterium uropygiale]|uniref:Uncharacterized protein n=1 Tax=Corynebacterium uropygiale TaxID=1775911 RepID=A0A9X1QLT7_9CORY|nr:hypothetical protein [Corynebacterium uropygiale]MCF4005622.1 hypothetical protein [Corynebacterium uropygiale]
MARHHDFYQSLHLPREASTEELRSELEGRLNALRSEGVSTGDARYQQTKVAADILGDEQRRSLYNARLDDDSAPDMNIPALRALASSGAFPDEYSHQHAQPEHAQPARGASSNGAHAADSQQQGQQPQQSYQQQSYQQQPAQLSAPRQPKALPGLPETITMPTTAKVMEWAIAVAGVFSFLWLIVGFVANYRVTSGIDLIIKQAGEVKNSDTRDLLDVLNLFGVGRGITSFDVDGTVSQFQSTVTRSALSAVVLPSVALAVIGALGAIVLLVWSTKVRTHEAPIATFSALIVLLFGSLLGAMGNIAGVFGTALFSVATIGFLVAAVCSLLPQTRAWYDGKNADQIAQSSSQPQQAWFQQQPQQAQQPYQGYQGYQQQGQQPYQGYQQNPEQGNQNPSQWS